MAIAAEQDSRVNTIMNEIVARLKDIFGENLRQVMCIANHYRKKL